MTMSMVKLLTVARCMGCLSLYGRDCIKGCGISTTMLNVTSVMLSEATRSRGYVVRSFIMAMTGAEAVAMTIVEARKQRLCP